MATNETPVLKPHPLGKAAGGTPTDSMLMSMSRQARRANGWPEGTGQNLALRAPWMDGCMVIRLGRRPDRLGRNGSDGMYINTYIYIYIYTNTTTRALTGSMLQHS